MDKVYEVLSYPVTASEEFGSIPYWFGGMPEVVKEYKTKAAALRYAKKLAQRTRRGAEVSMEWQEGNNIETFRQWFFP